MLSLSVVVPAADHPATLTQCLATIRSATDAPEEVIAVTEPSGIGCGEARNIGVARATADVIVFVDADVMVHPDVFTRVRAAFESDPGLTALFGSYDDAPPARSLVSAFRNLLHHHVHQTSGGPATTYWAALGAMRRKAFIAVGGFDEQWERDWRQLFGCNSLEDIELGMRLNLAGKRVVLDPGLQGTHLKTWSFKNMVVQDLCSRGLPWIVLLLRSGTSSTALNLGWRHRLSAAASLALAGSLGLRRPVLAVAFAGSLLALNRSFYGLLLRQRGLVAVGLGVPLHVIHLLTGVAAVPGGIATYLIAKPGPRSAAGPSNRGLYGCGGSSAARTVDALTMSSSLAPLISVVIPAYNSEAVVVETLQSVLAQTYRNLEVIVIDDGSTDRTRERVEAIDDARVAVHTYPNAGLSEARNRGIRRARGDLISFIDADDLWTRDKLESQLQALQRNPDLSIAYSWTMFIDERSRYLFAKAPCFFEGDVYRDLLTNNFIAGGSNVLARMSCIESVGFFNTNLKGSEDWEYFLRAARRCRFAVVPRYQVLYRFSSSSLSGNPRRTEEWTLRVIDQAYRDAPAEVQSSKGAAIAGVKHHSATIYLTRTPGPDWRRNAGISIRDAIRARPRCLLEHRMQAVLLAWVIAYLVPARAAPKLIRGLLRVHGAVTRLRRREVLAEAVQWPGLPARR